MKVSKYLTSGCRTSVLLLPISIILVTSAEVESLASPSCFNKELLRVISRVSNEPLQIMFLFLQIEKNTELANEIDNLSYEDFNEPQLFFTEMERMPRRSSYAPLQNVAPVALGKFVPSYMTVIVIATTNNFKKVTATGLASLVRTDYDTFVVMGEEQILKSYFVSPFGMGLRKRVGVNHQSNGNITEADPNCSATTYLVDPQIYSGGIMETTSHLSGFPNWHFSLNGRMLRVSANTLAPYIVFPGNYNATNNSVPDGGTHYTMLVLAASFYNFSLKWDIDPLRGNGKLSSDGNASGMLGEVLNGRADIAFIARLTKGQIGVIDLTTSNYVDTLVFLSRKPEANLEWTAVIHLFTWDTWITLLFAFVELVPLYYLHLKFTCLKKKKQISYFKSFMIPFGILISQSVPKIPQKAYVLTLFWMLFVLNLNIAYNSNLSSSLTKLKPEPVPQSFEQLAQRLDYNISFNYINNGSCDCFHFFNDSTSPLIIGIQNRFMDNLEPDTGRCIVRAILRPKNVCIGWESVTRIGIAQNVSLFAGLNLVRVSKSVHSSLNSIGFQRHSIYTRTFDGVFGRFRDMGIVVYAKRQAEALALEDGKNWLNNRKHSKIYQVLNKFLEDTYAKVKPFELIHFKFSYLLLFGGILLSVAAFLMELVTGINNQDMVVLITTYSP